MIDILISIIGAATAIIMTAGVWESCKMVDERKQRYRAGTHDYYDNEIKSDE